VAQPHGVVGHVDRRVRRIIARLLAEQVELDDAAGVREAEQSLVVEDRAVDVADDRAFRPAAVGGDEVHDLLRLVLLAAAAYPQKLPPLVHLSRWPRLSEAGMRLLGMRRIVRWTLRSIVQDPDAVTEEQVRGYADPLQGPAARRALLATGARIVPDDLPALVARYPEVRVPTLLLWGAGDRVVPPAVGRRLQEDLPDARLEVLERCGHLPAEERPRASWARVAAFLDETGDAIGGAPEPASRTS